MVGTVLSGTRRPELMKNKHMTHQRKDKDTVRTWVQSQLQEDCGRYRQGLYEHLPGSKETHHRKEVGMRWASIQRLQVQEEMPRPKSGVHKWQMQQDQLCLLQTVLYDSIVPFLHEGNLQPPWENTIRVQRLQERVEMSAWEAFMLCKGFPAEVRDIAKYSPLRLCDRGGRGGKTGMYSQERPVQWSFRIPHHPECRWRGDRLHQQDHTYIHAGVFDGIGNIDLPRKVRYKARRKAAVQPLKKDKTCRAGMTYADYILFREENPDTPVVQMDSVTGKKDEDEKVLLTLHIVNCRLMLAFIRGRNSVASII